MIPVVLEQGSPEWLVWRKGGIGSSDAIAIAADAGMVELKPWMDSLDDLYEEKLFAGTETPSNWRMERGHHLEPYARREFERLTGMPVQPICGSMDAQPMIRASFDGTSFDKLSFLELKAPNEDVHELAGKGRVVDYYRPQVAHQALVLWGRVNDWPADGRVNFGTYMPDDEKVPEKGTLHRVYIPAHKKGFREYAEALFAAECRFIENLINKVPPCGLEYAKFVVEHKAAKKVVEAAKADLKSIEDKMFALAKASPGQRLSRLGVTAAEIKRAGTVDYAKLCAEYGIKDNETERYRKPGTTYWQVRTSRKGEKAAAAKAAGHE